jgi:hypothetical protein
MKTGSQVQISKNSVILMAALLLFISALTPAQLTRRMWQMQNPAVPSNSIIVSFSDDNNYYCSVGDLATNQQTPYQGQYQLSGNNLTITVDGTSYSFVITKLTADNLELLNSSGRTLIYARITSSSDNFLRNYLNQVNSGGSNYYGGGGSSNNSYGSSSSQSEICYTCHGTGSCTVCHGTGSYSLYGFTSPCSACGGTGKCWHCNGTGKQ